MIKNLGVSLVCFAQSQHTLGPGYPLQVLATDPLTVASAPGFPLLSLTHALSENSRINELT